MKKNLFIYIATSLMALGGLSCSDFLDKEVDLSLSQEQIFSNFENTRGFLANVYTYLPDAFSGFSAGDGGQFEAAFHDCMSDNSISYWNVHYYNSIQSDTYDATNHVYAIRYWQNDLKGIRAANQFLKNGRESVVGHSNKTGDDNHLYDRNIAEARLLRAIYHFDMASYFGAIPLIGENEEGVPIVFEPTDAVGLNMSRTPCADALKWIADECDAIKDVLPFRYSNETENWGRVNGAAAYALKSRALLYRASALNNPGNDASWWQSAAQAAKDFISKNASQSNPYRLFTGDKNDVKQNYYQCFIATPHLNNEYILSRSEWTTNEIERYLAPIGFTGSINAIGRTNPTQNLIDSYEMKNGLPIDDPASGYDEQNPYANRDPRLEQTILHHGSIWGDKLQEEERSIDISYPGGTDYQALHGGTTTGYYCKKFLNNMSFKAPTTYTRACPIFRYAEILLNAAEAVNEAEGPDAAYKYVNEVRARSGMPAYGGMTKEKLRERIRNERRIELCFEDHRFFDIRRWKIYEGVTPTSEKNKPRYQQVYNLYSMQITPNAAKTYNVIPNSVRPTLSFSSPKNYLFPIPEDQVKKAPNLRQNPGWELSEAKPDDTPNEGEN